MYFQRTTRPNPSPTAIHHRPAALLERLEDRCLCSAAPGAAEVSTLQWGGRTQEVRTGEWILGVDPKAKPIQGKSATAQLSVLNRRLRVAGALGSARKQLGRTGQYLLALPGSLPSDPLLAAVRKIPGFSYLEPNRMLHTDALPNDEKFDELYGLHNTGQAYYGFSKPDADIDAPEAWDITTGSSDVVVGVIDTGVDYTHPDLAANMWHNPFETPGDGVDNDNNGFVDDVYGINAIANNGDPMDDHGHGTHTAGTIGAVGGDGVGVVGVNWHVKIMALKFLSAEGSGDTADAIECLNYATAMRQRGVNIKLTSNSWGGDEYEQALKDAIDAGANSGLLMVASAGNQGVNTDDVLKNYPGSYDSPNIICVAATDCWDGKPFWSNYGRTTVDIGAPGDGILSTVPGGYDTYSGTSMACPHVSGVAALAWSVKPDATWQEVKAAILAGADPVESMEGKVLTGGRLNAFNTLRALAGGTPNSISGSVYDDANHNGARDDGEAPLPGVTVYLDADDDGVYDGSEATVRSADVPVAIPEIGKTQSRLTVEGFAGSILDVDVNLNIAHTYESDLKVFLVAPDGRRVELFTAVGTSDDDFTDTTLDDEATTPITDGSSPFAGRFRPEGRLSDLDGLDPNGTWTLEVEDTEVNDAGVLNAWSLTVRTGELATTSSALGVYSFDSMAPGDYAVRQVVPHGRTQITPAGGVHRVVMEAGKVVGGRDFGDYTGTPPADASVVGRHVFYNHSAFDGNNAGADDKDDNAIATDKEVLLPGREGQFGNLTSYARGINGLMVDVKNLPAGKTPGLADFAFRVGNGRRAGDWATAPAPRSITVRRGAGNDGSDRLTFIWDDGAIRNTWLQVTVVPSVNTGLAVADTFYVGNLVGETGASRGVVDAIDYEEVRTWASTPAGRVGDAYDFNRDGKVNAIDLALVRGNQGRLLDLNVAVVDILGSHPNARRRLYA